jgi:hypothetical protein
MQTTKTRIFCSKLNNQTKTDRVLKLLRHIAIGCAFLYLNATCFAQDSTSFPDKVLNFPSKFFKKVNNQTADLDKQLEKQTIKYIQRLQKKEERLKRKLFKQDSAKAAYLYANDPEKQYEYLMQKLKTDSATVFHTMGPQYLPYVDSLQGALSFLNKNPQLLNSSNIASSDVQRSLIQLQQLQAKLQDADQIKQFIAQRKQSIQQYLVQYTKLPPGISNVYNGYKK